MELSQVLYEAARITSERGHCKGIEQDKDGHVCLIGAINLVLAADHPEELTSGGALHFSSFLRPFQLQLLQCIGETLQAMGVNDVWIVRFLEDKDPVPRPIDWNNLSRVTGEDVVLVLKETAERLAAEE